MKQIFSFLFSIVIAFYCFGQKPNTTLDSLKVLDSIILTSYLHQNTIRQLPAEQLTYLYTGKKTELIDMIQIPADLTNKTGRQIFSRIPGIFVYDMDGSGNQINIAARGLDPHRGWEFNIRKDGIITNSDMYGYPASHYSMPLESVGRIELVRGTGSLQYGAQFGGMLNYITKQANPNRPISFESINTLGSYNLLSTYNAIGGNTGRFSYYAYFYQKSRNGYRDEELTESNAQDVIITYQPSTNISIRAEWARSEYLYKIPGPLTDSMFYENPRQASRSRNYFNPDINIPSVSVNWQLSKNSHLQFTSSAILGCRNSVMFDKPVNIHDTINAATMEYNNRQVDIDHFNSYTSELRFLQHYRLWKQQSTVVAGIQYMNNDLHRTQLGKGTTGSDYDLTLVIPVWGRDLNFKTKNIAFFAENKFQLTSRFSISAGSRVEIGKTNMSGTIIYYPDNKIPLSIEHHFPLLGLNTQYKFNSGSEFYAGCSQAYRPVIFKDVIPGSLYEKVDPDIKDASGYNAELGYRGNWKFLSWDVTAFFVSYQNRIGSLAETDNLGNFYTYRTNMGNSFTKGLEILLQADWLINKKIGISLYTSSAFTDARYKNAVVKSDNTNINIAGNKVESTPPIITRNGASLRYKKASISVLYSYTAESYADALNTIEPQKTTGAIGLVPSYGLLDLNGSVRFSKILEVRINISNVTNKQYFTKRPTFYPGPGVWPSDGRNGSITFLIRL